MIAYYFRSHKWRACEQFFWMFCNPASLHTAHTIRISKKYTFTVTLSYHKHIRHKRFVEPKQFAIMVYYKSSNWKMRGELHGGSERGGAELIEWVSMTSIKEPFDGFHELIIIITNDVIHTHSLASLLCMLRCAYLFRWHWKLWDYYMVFFSSWKFFILHSLSLSHSQRASSFYPRCLLIISNELAYTLYESTHSFVPLSPPYLSLCRCWLALFWNGFTNLRTHQYGKTLKSLSLCSVIKAYEAHSHSKNLIALVGEIVYHKNKFIFLVYYE